MMKKELVIFIFSFTLVFIADLFYYFGWLSYQYSLKEEVPFLGIAIIFNIVVIGLLTYHFLTKQKHGVR